MARHRGTAHLRRSNLGKTTGAWDKSPTSRYNSSPLGTKDRSGDSVAGSRFCSKEFAMKLRAELLQGQVDVLAAHWRRQLRLYDRWRADSEAWGAYIIVG